MFYLDPTKCLQNNSRSALFYPPRSFWGRRVFRWGRSFFKRAINTVTNKTHHPSPITHLITRLTLLYSYATQLRSASGRPPVPRENTKSGDRDRSTRRVLTRSNESTHPLPIPSTPVLDVKNHHSNLMRRERKSVPYPTPNQPRKSASPVVENTFVETTRNHDLSPKEQNNKLHPTSTRTVSPMKPQHTRNHHDPIAIIDPKEIQTSISHESLKVLFVEMCVFGRMGFVQPPSCIRCILAKKKKNLPNEFDNRQCKNLVVWRRNANMGERVQVAFILISWMAIF